jgi:hypothetical protein
MTSQTQQHADDAIYQLQLGYQQAVQYVCRNATVTESEAIQAVNHALAFQH